MAKLVYGLNQSLDGYIDHLEFSPTPKLFRHFTEHVRGLAGMVYGRRMYEIMRYWDEDRVDWGAEEQDFAAAWRSRLKWIVSRSLKSPGPNATLVEELEHWPLDLSGGSCLNMGGPDACLASPDPHRPGSERSSSDRCGADPARSLHMGANVSGIQSQVTLSGSANRG